MNPTLYSDLMYGKKYYIYQPSSKYLSHAFYKGTFVDHANLPTRCNTRSVGLFEDVYFLKPLEYVGDLNFGKTELYYDYDKIKDNSIKAQQKMEKRALDIVLKRILNEDFVYYM